VTEAHLLVFAKAPQAGRVKTRLVPPLTPLEAARVHEASLLDVMAGAMESDAAVRILYDDTTDAAAYFARAFPGVESRPQPAGDLGRRLVEAFAAGFADGAACVVAIGADAPTLPRSYLSDGLAATLEAGAALGPAADGGYYLIGLRRDVWPNAEVLFDDIPWSTDLVCETTRQRAAEIGLPLRVLPQWYDIDRIDDLRLARMHTRADSHLARLLDGGIEGAAAKLLM
jgi:rSAM/selenodomain-associated transferase 1